MKTITYLFVLLSISMFAYHCGSDNPVNNGGSVPVTTTLLKVDSFSLHTTTPGNSDRDLNGSFQGRLGNFKLKFSLFCNNDTNTSDYMYYGIIQNGQLVIDGLLTHPDLNRQHEYSGLSDTTGLITYGISLHLKNTVNPPIEKILRVTDFTIIRTD